MQSQQDPHMNVIYWIHNRQNETSQPYIRMCACIQCSACRHLDEYNTHVHCIVLYCFVYCMH